MENQTETAASSAADDVFEGKDPTFDEYNSYRQTGELPARFKPAEPAEPAEPAPADAPEETEKAEGDEPEIEPEPAPEEAQEPPQKGSGAEKRIKQLLAKVKELERNQEAAAKPDVKPDPSPAPPQYTRPKPTTEDKNPDGTPKYATYEDWVEDVSDWKSEQRIAQMRREEAQQNALNALKTKLDDARTRYDDADDTIFPAAKTINEAPIPAAVKQVFADSDLFIDLCYVVGSDPDELKKFVTLAQTNPRAAIGKVFEYERGIKEELAKAKEPESGTAPVKRTSAPKPPAPVGGTASRAFDVSDESLSPEEWARKRTADLNKRGKA
jgi:hypothetical protein